MVHGYTDGEFGHSYFCLPSQWGQFLGGKNVLLKEQILAFKSRSPSVMVLSSKVANIL